MTRFAVRKAGLLACLMALPAAAQTFTSRGFLQTQLWFYPQAAPNDSGHAVLESLLRYEPSWKPEPWFRLNASFDARIDSHRDVQRSLHIDWADRSLRRPALSVRRLSAILSKGPLTAEFGKQFIRWGKADILNPTDRFSPKDFLNVVDTDILAVTAARLTYDNGTNSLDFVWQPRFTPSRTPLLNQRWTVLPAAAAVIPFRDLGSEFPGRSAFGLRWNHNASGFEYSLSYYDGFNHLPLFMPRVNLLPLRVDFRRIYPALRLYGGDLAAPPRWFTLKAEAAYYSSPSKQEDEYAIYVVQFERQVRELTLVGGYAGDIVTSRNGGLQFSPERGFARAFLGRAFYQLDPNRSFTLDVAARQNGRGTLARFEYSQAFGQHWRATAGFAWLRGSDDDFLGQYHRNSHATLALRYSF